jgi:hypothetical protein
MVDKDEMIYEILKKWVINDYKTPDVKAEVLIDMLISEYINQIYDVYPNLPGEGPSYFITKEFPIKNYTVRSSQDNSNNSKDYKVSKDNRSASVDYLIGKGDILYLTELKTDLNSFSDTQLIRMLMAKELGIDQFIEHYKNVLTYTGKKGKRLYQFKQFLENTGLTEASYIKKLTKNREDYSFLDKLKSRFSRIEIMYILLDRKMIPLHSKITNRDYSIELDEENNGSKKQYRFSNMLKDYHQADYGTMKYQNKDTGCEQTIYVMELKSCNLKNETCSSWGKIKSIIKGCK